jgi:XTP/dITP diphosphohydrolase
MKISVITRNPGKIKVANQVFKKYGLDYEFCDIEFPEIQATTSKEIAEFTAKQASEKFKKPVIREDASLLISALGFPGPFTAYLEKMIPAEKLLKMLEPYSDRSGYFECALSYCEPNKKPVTFVEKTEIEINNQETGNLRPAKSWDRILKLKGENRTFAEYPSEDRFDVWAKPYEKLAQYISAQILKK